MDPALYMPPGGADFACRRCWMLAYRSCQAHDKKSPRRDELLSKHIARHASWLERMQRRLPRDG
jgi:hypothetical protein